MIHERYMAQFVLLAVLSSGGANADDGPAPALAASATPTRTITLALRPMPTFKLMTPGKSAVGSFFSVVGFAISEVEAAKAGNDVVRQNQVEDPARALGAALLQELAARDHLQIRDPDGAVTTAESFKSIVRSYPGAELVLDVRTIQWAAMGVGFDPSHYGIQYWVHADLFEARSGNRLASGDCSLQPQRRKESPSLDELLADGAQRLKDLSAEAAERCHGELQRRLFSKAH